MLQWDVILYVEDDDGYAQIMSAVLSQSGFKHRLVHVPSGDQAKAYLSGTEQFSDRDRYPLPGLILADLKMPGMTGLELLKWVRSESEHKLLPFVILTSSEDLKDVTRAYQLGANSFLVKPPSVQDLKEMMKAVENFWIRHNVSP